MPFRNGEFDVVIARVSVPYTNVGLCLKEMRRVVRDGGDVWLVLHSFSVAWEQARASGFRGKIFFLYILFNSLCFHLFGRQIPFVRGKYESFQTESSMRRALAENDFCEVGDYPDAPFRGQGASEWQGREARRGSGGAWCCRWRLATYRAGSATGTALGRHWGRRFKENSSGKLRLGSR
jgi:hypothetical protein